jgi:hypothetical protein
MAPSRRASVQKSELGWSPAVGLVVAVGSDDVEVDVEVDPDVEPCAACGAASVATEEPLPQPAQARTTAGSARVRRRRVLRMVVVPFMTMLTRWEW